MICYDQFHPVGVQGNQHGGRGPLSGMELSIWDLRQAFVIPNGTHHGGTGCAGEIRQAGCGGVFAVGLGKGYDMGVKVRGGKVHRLLQFAGNVLVADDAVHCSRLERRDLGIPVELHNLELAA
ncbi:hypothetical protein SDC9_109151 [bioreactor metagenome]|uniref:Uncharacterized protein n=1 Tax=bioreactor metagenome TaxID=1076179 RepID=A0A645BA23_9ZZZZ